MILAETICRAFPEIFCAANSCRGHALLPPQHLTYSAYRPGCLGWRLAWTAREAQEVNILLFAQEVM